MTIQDYIAQVRARLERFTAYMNRTNEIGMATRGLPEIRDDLDKLHTALDRAVEGLEDARMNTMPERKANLETRMHVIGVDTAEPWRGMRRALSISLKKSATSGQIRYLAPAGKTPAAPRWTKLWWS